MDHLGSFTDLLWTLLISTVSFMCQLLGGGLVRGYLVKDDLCSKETFLHMPLSYFQQTNSIYHHRTGQGPRKEVGMCKYIFNLLFCFTFTIIIFCHVTEPESKWEGTKSDKAKGIDTRRPLMEAISTISSSQIKSTGGEGLTHRQNMKEGSERIERDGAKEIKVEHS